MKKILLKGKKLKQIITAINNNLFSEELNKSEDIKLVNKDIQYREGILEALEKNANIDILIISEKLPGNIEFENLIEKIKEKNENINIIFILEKENFKIRSILKKYNINNIFFNNEININNLINIIENKKNNINEIEKNNNKKIKKVIINKLKIKFKNNIKLIKNKFILKNDKKINTNIIITINGENGVGKSIISIFISEYFSNINKKILLVDYNKNIKCILGIKNKNSNNICKYNSKINIIEFYDFIKEDLSELKNNYDIIIIDFCNNNNYEEKRKIIKNANFNLIIMESNLLGIKITKKIIDILKNILNNFNNIYIIQNKINIYSVDNELIKKCFPEINILGKIKYRSIYNEFINKNFNYNFISKKVKFYKVKNEYKKIIKKII